MVDFLIIGHGIAGAVLARTLINEGQTVKVIDHAGGHSSSKVAAGLCNPITGRKFSLSWEAENLFPALDVFYTDFENKTGISFYHPMPIYRVCASTRELNDWSSKAALREYQPFVSDGFTPDPALIDAPYGTIGTLQGGYVNIPKFLEASRQLLGNDLIEVPEAIDSNSISVSEESVSISGMQNTRARHLILCDGYLATQKPFFADMPFTPMKGEILELEIPDMYRDRIFIRGGFLVPFDDDIFLAGATYEWKDLSLNTSEAAKSNILERLKTYVVPEIKVKGQRVGIRPAVKDRKPLIGTHGKLKNVHLFNGMGSKGTSLVPYLSKIFVDHLLLGRNIPQSVNLNRFYSK